MNILIVTIGNSDVQIKAKFAGSGFILENSPDNKALVLKKTGLDDINVFQNRNHDNYLIAQPRLSGEKLNKHFASYYPVLEFPIIIPVVEKLISEVNLAEIWFVYTNQSDIDDKYKKSDTLFFKDIIKKAIHEEFPNVTLVDYEVSEQVTNIDFQYEDFFRKGKRIIAEQEKISKIYLLPQGGIDQINTALTLQFIQLFKDKLVLYQKAEGADSRQLFFPQRFLNDLNKAKIVEHINNYDFRFAIELMPGNEAKAGIIKKLCSYAADRLELLHATNIFTFNDKNKEEQVVLGAQMSATLKSNFRTLSTSHQSAYKLSDLIYQCKICFLVQKDFNKGIVLFFTVIENLIKIEIEKSYSPNHDLKKYRKNYNGQARNVAWEDFIETIDCDLLVYLGEIKIGDHPLDLKVPNRLSYFYIYSYLISNNLNDIAIDSGQFKRFFDFCESIAGKRNELAHNLGGISESTLNPFLNRANYNIETMFQPIDQIAGTSGFGIYEEIQQKVLKLLDA